MIDRLAAVPAAFVHGEFYASNVLVDLTPGRLRVCPVDWEMAGLGPGLVDLAALVTGWAEEDREALALRYHSALPSRGGWAPTYPEFRVLLDCSRLMLAVRWLGWSPQWSPPEEHARDWLADAMELADGLGL